MKKFIPYTSDEIANELKNRVIEAGIINEVDLQPGSNTRQIIDLLSYVGSVINTNTTFGVNEMILTQSTKRQNILKVARQLGYEPHRKYSYIYKIRLTVKESGLISLPTFTRFISGNRYYYYMGASLEGRYSAGDIIDIEVKEGVLIHYKEDVGLAYIIDHDNLMPDIEGLTPIHGNYFDIDYDSIEEDGIDMWVSEPPYKSTQRWIKRDFNTDVPLTRLDAMDNTFTAIRNIEHRNIRVQFNYNGVGRLPTEGSHIHLVCLISSGSYGIAEDDIKLNDENVLNIDVLPGFQKLMRQGTEEESDDDIKEHAPLFHSSAYRAVTADDYKVILNKNALVDSTQVWGGEETFPPVLGHVWFSSVSSKIREATLRYANGSWTRNYSVSNLTDLYVESLDIDNMILDLEGFKIITIQTHHEQPKFMRVDFEIDIINESFILDEIKQKMATRLFELFTNKYEVFDSEFYESNIIRELDTILGDTNGITCKTSSHMILTHKDMVPVVSYDEYWAVGEEDRYINTCGLCLNDEYASDYGSDINLFLGFPYERVFNTTTGELITDNLPQIDTDNFLQNIGLNIPMYNKLYVNWDGAFKQYTSEDKFMTFPIMFNEKISGRYMIINTSKRKYIQIKIYVCSRRGKTFIDRYDLSGLLDTHFEEAAQKINIVYKTPDIRFIKNTIPLLNKVTFV
jgi:hypothetical protein